MPEVKHYSVRFNGGPRKNEEDIRAQIHLFGGTNKMVGTINFYELGNEIPENKEVPFLIMGMPLTMVHSTIDILRNEKPIFISWQPALKNVFLSTTQEPVGEGE